MPLVLAIEDRTRARRPPAAQQPAALTGGPTVSSETFRAAREISRQSPAIRLSKAPFSTFAAAVVMPRLDQAMVTDARPARGALCRGEQGNRPERSESRL